MVYADEPTRDSNVLYKSLSPKSAGSTITVHVKESARNKAQIIRPCFSVMIVSKSNCQIQTMVTSKIKLFL
jgi:hypothetical protein